MYKTYLKERICYLYVAVVALLCTACNEQKSLRATLERAEALMEAYPDSAYTLLRSIDIDQLRRTDSRARYALLYTMAEDKNYIDATSDSLIRIASAHYASTNNHRQRFLSLYYHGRIYSNGGRHTEAIVTFSQAEQLAERIDDHYAIGLLYTAMGDSYKNHYDYTKALETYIQAYNHYQIAGKEKHMRYNLLQQGDIQRAMMNYSESEQLYKEAFKKGEVTNDSVLMRHTLATLLMQYIDQSRFNEAEVCYEELQTYKNKKYSSTFWASIAELYAAQGNRKLSEMYIDKAWLSAKKRQDSISLYHSEANMKYRLQNYKEAYHSLVEGVDFQYRMIRQALQQPLITAQRNYLAAELEHQAYRHKTEKQLHIIYILFSLTLIVGGIFYFRRLIKKKDEDIIRYCNALSELQETMQRDSSHKSELIRQLFKEQFSIVNMLGNIFYNSNEQKLAQNLKKDIGLFIKQLNENQETYQRLEDIVNHSHNYVMKKLRNEIKLPPKSYRLFCFYYAGFSSNLICTIFDEKEDNIYQRKKRIVAKIKESDAPHKEDFLKTLSKRISNQ